MSGPRAPRSGADLVALAVLLAALLGGLALRANHLDDPPIGYHNDKENEYLSQAIRYQDTGLSWRRQVHFFEGHQVTPYLESYAQLPLLPWVGLAAWGVFGESYWAMRLQIVLYALGALVLAFALTRRVTGNPVLAALTATLMAVLPASVYFGRNLQPDIPALFWLLAFFLLFSRWRASPRALTAAGASVALALAGLYKISFLVPALAVIPWIPWRRLGEDLRAGRLSPWLPFSLFLVCPAILAAIAANGVLETQAGITHLSQVRDAIAGRVQPWRILTPDFWSRHGAALRIYTVDNYTAVFALLAALGLALLAVRRTSCEGRPFFVALMLSALVYLALFADFLNQHAYYQLPYLYLLAVAVAYPVVLLFDALAARVGRPWLRWVALLLLALNAGPVSAGIDRHFASKTLGLDVAGATIGRLTQPDERILFMGTYPHVGVCTFAERFCIRVPKDPLRLEAFEKDYGARFMYVAADHLAALQALPSWSYVAAHYRVRQLALIAIPSGGYRRIHYVLERGGRFQQPRGDPRNAKLVATYDVQGARVDLLVLEP